VILLLAPAVQPPASVLLNTEIQLKLVFFTADVLTGFTAVGVAPAAHVATECKAAMKLKNLVLESVLTPPTCGFIDTNIIFTP
jgi:hypothetical protein